MKLRAGNWHAQVPAHHGQDVAAELCDRIGKYQWEGSESLLLSAAEWNVHGDMVHVSIELREAQCHINTISEEGLTCHEIYEQTDLRSFLTEWGFMPEVNDEHL